MRIYLINLKPFLLKTVLTLLFVALTAYLLVSIFQNAAADVFTQKKQIPIYSVETGQKQVALTFDCAWGADDIPQILDTLERENVKASFFLVGHWAKKFPESVNLMYNNGHDIANHGFSHLRMGALNKDRIKGEIAECGTVIENIIKKKPDLFRPPYGDYSNSVVDIAKKLGYYTIQWDVDSLDWKKDISRDTIIERVVSRVRNGSIILMHNDTTHTAHVLPDIIKSIKSKGFEFVPVSRLILRENYTVDYAGRQKRTIDN